MHAHESIEVVATVDINVRDDAPADWLTRVTDPDEFPYTHHDRSPLTEREGLEHLAYNAVANGVEDASRLDGWGDLERGQVTLDVHDVEVTR